MKDLIGLIRFDWFDWFDGLVVDYDADAAAGAPIGMGGIVFEETAPNWRSVCVYVCMCVYVCCACLCVYVCV